MGDQGKPWSEAGRRPSLAAEERRGRTIITVLNGLLLPLIGADAGLQAAWTTAKRVARKPGVKIGARASAAQADATTQGSTAAPATPPAASTPPASQLPAV